MRDRGIDVRKLRARLSMSQHEFATRFGLNILTLRDWEQGRRSPLGPARVLLELISRSPDDVMRTLETLAAD